MDMVMDIGAMAHGSSKSTKWIRRLEIFVGFHGKKNSCPHGLYRAGARSQH